MARRHPLRRRGGAQAPSIDTLANICQGGIYDHLGGGFARYSVDDRWLVPHFEKMLYDNALLVELLTEVWRETQTPLFAARIAETVAWLQREMIAEGGGFAASLDADSEGEEGKFYVWTADEIVDVLGAEDARFFAQVYDVTPDGNWEGHTILNRLRLAGAALGRGGGARSPACARSCSTPRAARVRPGWDDKVLADWNGLMIAALARAGRRVRQAGVAGARATRLRLRRDEDERRRAAHARLARRPRQGAGHRQRLRQHDLGARCAARGDRRAALSRAGGAPGSTSSTATTGSTAAGGYVISADDTRDVIVRMRHGRRRRDAQRQRGRWSRTWRRWRC